MVPLVLQPPTCIVHLILSSDTDVSTAWPNGQDSGLCLMEQGPETSTSAAWHRPMPPCSLLCSQPDRSLSNVCTCT